MGPVDIDIAVEGAVGYGAEVERGRAKSPELAPCPMSRGQTGEADDGLAQLGATAGANDPTLLESQPDSTVSAPTSDSTAIAPTDSNR